MAGTVNQPTVTLPFQVRALTIEDGMELATWRYPGAWAVYDALETPRPDEGYWAVSDASDALVGLCCFGHPARPATLPEDPAVLDVRIGIRPDLVGHGHGDALGQTVVAHARSVAEGRRLRCAVATWNAPGRRVALASGFTETGTHQAERTSYVVFEQP